MRKTVKRKVFSCRRAKGRAGSAAREKFFSLFVFGKAGGPTVVIADLGRINALMDRLFELIGPAAIRHNI